jgi:hypothetical protein
MVATYPVPGGRAPTSLGDASSIEGADTPVDRAVVSDGAPRRASNERATRTATTAHEEIAAATTQAIS